MISCAEIADMVEDNAVKALPSASKACIDLTGAVMGNSNDINSRTTHNNGQRQVEDKVAAVSNATEYFSADCDEAVLESIESCVGCVEGVDVQHEYEEALVAQARYQRNIAAQHGLSEAEAAMIRLQLMEEKRRNANTSSGLADYVSDMDIIHLCGGSDDDKSVVDARHRRAAAAGATSKASTASENQNPKDERCKVDSLVQRESNGNRISCTGKSLKQWDGKIEASLPPAGGCPPFGMAKTSNTTDTVLSCAICFDEVGNTSEECSPSKRRGTFAYLPCCGSDGRERRTTTKVCTACILLLTHPTSDGSSRVGRCPRCRSWIVVEPPVSPTLSNLLIREVASAGKCMVCCQVRPHLVENESVCDACFLGRRQPLMYECEQCHILQLIPHPMYRYQPSVNTFGDVSWACQGSCRSFTKWRIHIDQVNLIPAGDAPQTWGEDYLEAARSRVMEARRGMLVTAGQGLANQDADACSIL